MPNFIPGQIQVIQGHRHVSDTTNSNDLIIAGIAEPEVHELLTYQYQRTLICKLTGADTVEQGLTNPIANYRVPPVDSKRKVGAERYNFPVVRNPRRATVIVNQVGSGDPDGTFQLTLKDNAIYPGMVVKLNNVHAEYVSHTGSVGAYVYTLKTKNGSVFDLNTVYAGISGEKTCIGAYTEYEQGSDRGHGRYIEPDMYTTFTTIQRKEGLLTGDAKTQKTYLRYNRDGGEYSGYIYTIIEQHKKMLAAENEYQKFFGESNMKEADGSIKSVIPTVNGKLKITGDGFVPQFSGTNTIVASGIDGLATVTDLFDLMEAIVGAGNQEAGMEVTVFTGTPGMRKIQFLAPELAKLQNVYYTKSLDNDGKIGGATGITGQTFHRIDAFGNTFFFCLHPMFDDKQLFPEYNSKGQHVQGNTMIAITITVAGEKNAEILAKGLNGEDRANIYAYIKGMTSEGGNHQHTGDYDTFSLLKQDLTLLRNADLCGMILPAA